MSNTKEVTMPISSMNLVRDSKGTFLTITTKNKLVIDKIFSKISGTGLDWNGESFSCQISRLNKRLVVLVGELISHPGVAWKYSSNFKSFFLEELKKLSAVEIKKGNYDYRQDLLVKEEYRKMWPHQEQGAFFLETVGFRAILRDAPRLGKCFTVLSPAVKKNLKIRILCPPELIPVWEKEITPFTRFYHVNYEILSYDKKKFPKEFLPPEGEDVERYLLIVDETHRLSKRGGQRFKNVFTISKHFKKVVLLSGNNPEDDPHGFYSELKILFPDKLTLETYVRKYIHTDFVDGRVHHGSFKTTDWESYMDYFYIRRTEEDIGVTLVNESETTFGISDLSKKRIENKIKDEMPLDYQSSYRLQKFLSLEKKVYVKKLIDEHKMWCDTSILIFSSHKDVLAEYATLTKSHVIVSTKDELDTLVKSHGSPGYPALILVCTMTLKEGFYIPGVMNIIMLDTGPKGSRHNQIIKRASQIGKNPTTVFTVNLDTPIDHIFREVPPTASPERALKIVQDRVEKEIFKSKK